MAPPPEEEEDSILATGRDKGPVGIFMTVQDPDLVQIDKELLASNKRVDGDEKFLHLHKSYHKIATKTGMYRMCLFAHKHLFRDSHGLKYEMGIQTEAITDLQLEVRQEQDKEGGVPMFQDPRQFLTREHFQEVDLTIRALEGRAEAVIADQAFQRDSQREVQHE